MCDNVVDTLGALRRMVAELDVDALDDSAAVGLVEFFVEAERLVAAGRLLATKALEHSDHWRRAGYRSAAAWMAAQAGAPSGPAITAMEMVGLLDDLPAVAAAFRSGRLSVLQAQEIVDAATGCPDAELQLLDAAEKLTLSGLREECRRVKAAAIVDEEDRYRKLRKGRYCRSWTGRDGAVRLSARVTPDEGARLLAEIDARRDEIVAGARRGGWYESLEAHRADALVEVALTSGGGEPSGPQTTVHVLVDYEALVRGHTLEGEVCEIPGVGPIPVAVARRLAQDCFLKVLVTKGVDIEAVAHAGRNIPAHIRTALEVRDPQCIVPQCDIRRRLQIDHNPPYKPVRWTSLAGLARLCQWHHYQKSHQGYTYRGGPGTWEWIPPEIPTDPPLYPP